MTPSTRRSIHNAIKRARHSHPEGTFAAELSELAEEFQGGDLNEMNRAIHHFREVAAGYRAAEAFESLDGDFLWNDTEIETA